MPRCLFVNARLCLWAVVWLLSALGVSLPTEAQVVLRPLPLEAAELGQGLGRFHAGPLHWTIEGGPRTGALKRLLPTALDFNRDQQFDWVVLAEPEREGVGRRPRFWLMSFGRTNHSLNVLKTWQRRVPIAASVNVLGAGDFNGDGRADLIAGLGAESDTPWALYQGGIEKLHLEVTRPSRGSGQSGPGGERGLLVADVNQDGISDLILGTPGGTSSVGRVELFLGSKRGLGDVAVWKVESESPGESFGESLALLDANGDGRLDLAVGAPVYQESTGRVSLFLGRVQSFSDAPSWTASGSRKHIRFGHALSRFGDLDKDGRDELAVGAPGDGEHTGNWQGQASVFRGEGVALSADPIWRQPDRGGNYGACYGASVAGVGDVNGDGWPDLLVGAPSLPPNFPIFGHAVLYAGNSNGLPTLPTWNATAISQRTSTGSAVTGLGDVNHDGLADFAVASSTWGAGGRVDIFFGRAGLYLPKTEFPMDRLNSSSQAHAVEDLEIIGKQDRAWIERQNHAALSNQVVRAELKAQAGEQATRHFQRLLLALPFIVALAIGLWLWRRKRLAAAVAETTSRRERERLSRDLHDDIGSRLSRISLLTELVRREGTQTEQGRKNSEALAESTRDVLKALEEILWSEKPTFDNLESTVMQIAQYAESFLAPVGIICKCQLPEAVPDRKLSSSVRKNVFLVVKEALNNLAKHSQATEARIVVTFADPRLAISIEDNGRGLNGSANSPTLPHSNPRQGHGVDNMRARVESIGGDFAVLTPPDGGTRVHLELNVPTTI